MSELTTSATRARSRAAELRFVVAVVATYAVVGGLCGWLWYTLWEPTTGVVYQHQWYADGDGLRAEFSGTGLYVLVAAGAGLLLGLACALAGARHPLLTLVVVALSSVLAAWLMMAVGTALGPADPQTLARTAEDGTALPGSLHVTGLTPLLAFPVGSVAALAVVFGMFGGQVHASASESEPRR